MADPLPTGTLLTAEQLAARLNLSVQQVHRLSASGRIPRYKLGHRTVRFNLDEVLAALQAPASTPARPAQRPERAPKARPELQPRSDLPSYDWSTRT